MRRVVSALAVLAALVFASPTMYAAKPGEAAPDFAAKDTKGNERKLADYKGRYVVLEWHNQGCPFVQKHYNSGNMQRLQSEWTAKGVVWLTVISSAPGQQGFVTGAQADAYVTGKKAAPTAVLLDPDGTVGRAYEAKTTPHMFVIDPKGVLLYNGAIDDKPTTELSDIPAARNYVAEALTTATAGKPVQVPTSRPYGCGVKYAR